MKILKNIYIITLKVKNILTYYKMYLLRSYMFYDTLSIYTGLLPLDSASSGCANFCVLSQYDVGEHGCSKISGHAVFHISTYE